MNLMNDNVDALRHYVEKVFQKMSNEMDSQSVVSGTIEESVPGHYKVTLINGSKTSLVDAYPMGGDQVYEKGDQVFLLKAESRTGNNFIVKYYVCGLVSDLEEDFEKSSVSERFIQVGEKREYIEQKNDISKYKYVDSSIVSDIKKGGALLVEATITAEIGELSKNNVENYGLTVSFLDGSNQVLFEGNLDVNYIEGQPYNLVESHQARVIEINSIVLPQIAKVQVTGFNELTGKTITIHKIRLQPGYVESPYSSLKVEIEPVGGDGYFKSGKSLTLKANVTYSAQKLFSEYLEYYWFYADRSVTSNSDSFMIEAGEGWHCVNEKNYAYTVTKNGADYVKIEDKSRYTLKPMGSTFSFSPANVGNTTRPKIKCIVKYKRLMAEDIYQVGNVTSSNPNVQQNPEIMGFNVKLVSSNETNTLLQPTDKIALTCEITDIQGNKIEYKNTTGFEFNWFVGENKPLRPNEDNPEDTEGTFITAGTLVVDNDNVINNSIEDGEVFYDMTDSDAMFVDIYCIVKRVADGLIEQTNSIRIVSNILEEIKTKTYYRYYYHTSSQITFQQDGGGEWQGYEYTDVKEEEGKDKKPQWTVITDFAWRRFVDSNGVELANEEAYSRLYGIENEIKEVGTWWVYYTSKVSSSDWSQPQLYKQVEITQSGDKFSGEVKSNPQLVEQTNTFNELTQYGTKQGGFYTENEEYYINADYIKTGALKVADNNGNVLFNANISTDNPEVQIAGFTVNGANNSLVAGTQGPSDENKNVGPGAGTDYRYFGYDGLQVGKWLWINEEGVFINKATKLFEQYEDGTLSVEPFDTETWVVYTTQEVLSDSDIPKREVDKKTGEVTFTNIAIDDNEVSDDTIWYLNKWKSNQEWKWMCQKIDYTLNDNEPWSGFIPLFQKEARSPNNMVDYYCLSASKSDSPPLTKNNVPSTPNSDSLEEKDGTEWVTKFTPPTSTLPYVWNFEAIYSDASDENNNDSTLLYVTTPTVIFTYGKNVKSAQEYIAFGQQNDKGEIGGWPAIFKADGTLNVVNNTDEDAGIDAWVLKNNTFIEKNWVYTQEKRNVRLYDITVFILESESGAKETIEVFGEPSYVDLGKTTYTLFHYNPLTERPNAPDISNPLSNGWEAVSTNEDNADANWSSTKEDYGLYGCVAWGTPHPMRGATGDNAPTQYEFVIEGDSDVRWVDKQGNEVGTLNFNPKIYINYGTQQLNLSDSSWKISSSAPSQDSTGNYIVYQGDNLEYSTPIFKDGYVTCAINGLTEVPTEGEKKYTGSGELRLMIYVDGKVRDIDRIKLAQQVNVTGIDVSVKIDAETIKRELTENNTVTYTPSTVNVVVLQQSDGKEPTSYSGNRYYHILAENKNPDGTLSSRVQLNCGDPTKDYQIDIATCEKGNGDAVLQSIQVIVTSAVWESSYGTISFSSAAKKGILLGGQTITFHEDGQDGASGTSPYLLEITDDFCSVPFNADGSEAATTTQVIQSWQPIITLWKGDEIQELNYNDISCNNYWVNAQSTSDSSKVQLNIHSYLLLDTNEDRVSVTITHIPSGASATIEAIKQKNGKDGSNAVMYSIMPSATEIIATCDSSGTILSYLPQTIFFELTKIDGTKSESVTDKTTFFYGVDQEEGSTDTSMSYNSLSITTVKPNFYVTIEAYIDGITVPPILTIPVRKNIPGKLGPSGAHGTSIELTTITTYYQYTEKIGTKEPTAPEAPKDSNTLGNWEASIAKLNLGTKQGGKLWQCIITKWNEISYDEEGNPTKTEPKEEISAVTEAQLATSILAWKGPNDFTEINGDSIVTGSIQSHGYTPSSSNPFSDTGFSLDLDTGIICSQNLTLTSNNLFLKGTIALHPSNSKSEDIMAYGYLSNTHLYLYKELEIGLHIGLYDDETSAWYIHASGQSLLINGPSDDTRIYISETILSLSASTTLNLQASTLNLTATTLKLNDEAGLTTDITVIKDKFIFKNGILVGKTTSK